MTEMQERATSPKAPTASRKSSLTALVLDKDDHNTAFTRRSRADILEFLAREELFSYHLLFLVAQTPTRESLENALTQGGFTLDPLDAETISPFARTAAKYQTLLHSSLGPEEAAELLDTNVEDVMQRLMNRTLYGIPSEDGLKIPRFQFEDGYVLPGLEEVLPLLDNDLHPVAVQNWFTIPNTDLLINDEAVSPRQWLLSGRSTNDVARIAIDL